MNFKFLTRIFIMFCSVFTLNVFAGKPFDCVEFSYTDQFLFDALVDGKKLIEETEQIVNIVNEDNRLQLSSEEYRELAKRVYCAYDLGLYSSNDKFVDDQFMQKFIVGEGINQCSILITSSELKSIATRVDDYLNCQDAQKTCNSIYLRLLKSSMNRAKTYLDTCLAEFR